MRRLLALLFLVLIAGCTGTPAPFVYDAPGNVVFMSRADSPHGELYVMNTTGHIVRLTHNERHENNPALSRDGSKVAFHGGNESNMLSWEIFVIDLATGQETQLTNNFVLDGHPDWSPDGTQLVFASFRDTQGRSAGTADIYIINVEGTGERLLIQSPYEDNDPEWSPDGWRIAFKSTRDTKEPHREEIYVANADGSNPRRLTETAGWQSDHDPAWSLTSNAITFMRFEGEVPWVNIANFSFVRTHLEDVVPWNSYRVDLRGNIWKLTDAKHIAALPVWSPNGNEIMFIDIEFIEMGGTIIGAWHRLTTMRTDGANKTRLMPDNEHVYTLEYFDW